MKSLTHSEILLKLIGNISPCGRSEIDNERMENLKTLCELVDILVSAIDSVAYENKDSHEHSVKEMASYAKNFLTKTLGIVE
jgi:hypothetical protein